ncbi:MAG: sigma-70 family RNA polymerase sigma factor [Hyphomicrobiales bacterium]|nr:sigma-70 family RNA polymerase sigma factor [Hyphomicrobiales bacterium]
MTAAPSADDMKRWLAAVAQDQDRAAFGRLFQFFAPRVAAFMQRAGLNASEAEDVAQETMVAVWRKAGMYDPAQANVSTWVFTIARNLRIDGARKSARAAAGVAVLSYETPDVENSAEEDTLASERDARVRRAMATLSPAQASVLKLSFFSEKPHAQIARELNIPLGTVKSRARLAMAKIRAILEQEP